MLQLMLESKGLTAQIIQFLETALANLKHVVFKENDYPLPVVSSTYSGAKLLSLTLTMISKNEKGREQLLENPNLLKDVLTLILVSLRVLKIKPHKPLEVLQSIEKEIDNSKSVDKPQKIHSVFDKEDSDFHEIGKYATSLLANISVLKNPKVHLLSGITEDSEEFVKLVNILSNQK